VLTITAAPKKIRDRIRISDPYDEPKPVRSNPVDLEQTLDLSGAQEQPAVSGIEDTGGKPVKNDKPLGWTGIPEGVPLADASGIYIEAEQIITQARSMLSRLENLAQALSNLSKQ